MVPREVFAFTITTPPNSLTLSSGLVGWWTFDGKDTNWATGITNDVSGNGNNGQMINMSTTTSPVAGKAGQALAFNGTNQYIINSSLIVNGAGTVSLWAKSSDISFGLYPSWINDRTTNTLEFGYTSTGGSRIFYKNSGYFVGTYTQPRDGKWHFYSFSSDGTNGKLYIDGQYQETVAYNFSVSGLWIARGANYFDGSLDDVRVYNRALSAGEIQQLYNIGSASHINVPPALGQTTNCTSGLSCGLVGWWTFDGKDTNWATGITNDVSGNGNNGQMINMSTTTSPVAGKVGQALAFNGTNQVITTTNTLNPSAVTVSLWFKLNKNQNSFFTCENSTSYLSLRYATGHIYSGFSFPTTGSSDAFSWTFDNNWHHLVSTWDGSTHLVYLDDMNQTLSHGIGMNSCNVSSSITIGAALADRLYIGGSLDDLRVYNRALSAGEVQQLYNIGSASHINVPPALGQTTNCTSGLSCGLVGWWTFDGKDTNWATGITQDISGNGNNGQMINMSTTTSPVAGKVGQALAFNGTNQYVNNGYFTNIDNQNALTISAWIKVKSFSDYEAIFSKYASSATLRYEVTLAGAGLYGVGTNNKNILWSIGNGSGSSYGYTTSNLLSANSWFHIVTVYNGSGSTDSDKAKIYINGVQQTVAFSGTAIPSAGPNIGNVNATIGERNNGSIYWNGSIDDLRVYNRALSAGEVQQLYNMGR
ncbi:hypothetical protein KGQ31_00010 [Patescibacteria group bacterium]|nr:hypothetical protein [Patescibacteria group bacterium]